MSKTFATEIKTEPEALFDRVRALAEKEGVKFTGDTQSGTFSGKGISGSYRRVGKYQLIITIDNKPMIAPWGLVEKKIRDFFESA